MCRARGAGRRVRLVLLEERPAAVKLKTAINGGLAVVVAFAVISYTGGIPSGWFTDNDDSSRNITLIALSSNDSLLVTAKAITSLEGTILNVADLGVDDNSWDYTFTVRANEHVRVEMIAEVFRQHPEDRASVQCRIEDNGDVVDRDKSTTSSRRERAIVACEYTS